MAACSTAWRISITETMMTTCQRIFSSKTRAAQEGPHIQLLANVLQAFPSGVGALTWGERLSVLDAWVQVLDGVYAHLPLTRALYGPLPADSGEVETAKFVSGGVCRCLRGAGSPLHGRAFAAAVVALRTLLLAPDRA
jgi:hypothetical protein